MECRPHRRGLARRRRFRHFLLGSVSEAVAMNANCSVVVVRGSARSARKNEGQGKEKVKRRTLSTAHFRVALRLLVGDAGPPTLGSLREADSCLPLHSCWLVGLVSSAPAVSAAILPPSFSHRSSIFFFRRFLSIGLAIALSSFLC